MKIAIIGAGPRGLSVAERVIEWARLKEEDIQLTMFDPYGVGGKVWRENQPLSLLMNSVTSQVTLFTDTSFTGEGPIVAGPNLYEWTKEFGFQFIQQHHPSNRLSLLKECQELGPNDHCSRVMYGLYQKWFFERLQTRLTNQTSITFFSDNVTAVKRNQEKYYVYTKSVEFTADQVIMALGHQENQLTDFEQGLADYAGEHRLFYSSPKNAADALPALKSIPEQQPVIIRGLGLAFFDYLTLLTTERGGVYETKAGKYHYQASGKEPLIIAGSGRGFPYHPRGLNQKEYGVQYVPAFLTPNYLKKARQQGRISPDEFFGLLKKEVELAYYLALIDENYPSIEKTKFKQRFIKEKGSTEAVLAFSIEEASLFDWAFIEHPEEQQAAGEGFRSYLLDYLTWDITEAQKGNQTGPITTAFDSLKDLRDQVRFIMDEELLMAVEYKQWLWEWFTPLSAFLSIGPPVERIMELKALIEAGIVIILGPDMRIEMKEGQFITYSEGQKANQYSSHFIIEARIPKTNNRKSLNPLTQQLLADELVGLHQLEIAKDVSFETGSLSVDPWNNQLISPSGEKVAGVFSYGIPTEGVHWLTAATARPGVDAWNLREADRIAATIFMEE